MTALAWCDYCAARGTITVYGCALGAETQREETCDHCGGTRYEPDVACQRCLDGDIHDHCYEPVVGRASASIPPGQRAVAS